MSTYRFKQTSGANPSNFYIVDDSETRYIKLPTTGEPSIHKQSISGGSESTEALFNDVVDEISLYLRVGQRPSHSPS